MRYFCFVLLLFVAFGSKAQVKASDVTGKWITEETKSVVEIYEQDGKYYGKIIWLKEPFEDDGKTLKIDDKNPDPKLRSREIKGMVIISDFTFDGEMWDKGKVYDPESGNTYSGHMRLRSDDILDLRGYIGISMLGRTATWVRKK